MWFHYRLLLFFLVLQNQCWKFVYNVRCSYLLIFFSFLLCVFISCVFLCLFYFLKQCFLVFSVEKGSRTQGWNIWNIFFLLKCGFVFSFCSLLR